MSEQSKQIYSLIPKVMADIGAIGKDRKNEKQGYKFRGIDDVYNAANSALSKHGVFSVPTVMEETRTERTNSNGTLLFSVFMKIKYTFYAPDGSFVDAVVSCEAFDSGDKATNKALSAAQKYAFLQVFCIPTEEPKDSEIDDHEVLPSSEVAQSKTESKKYDFTEETEKRDKALSAIAKASTSLVLGKILAQIEKYYREGIFTEDVYGELSNEVTKKSLEITPKGEK
jgi:hypothetical protein